MLVIILYSLLCNLEYFAIFGLRDCIYHLSDRRNIGVGLLIIDLMREYCPIGGMLLAIT
jgi:hypothetical protein